MRLFTKRNGGCLVPSQTWANRFLTSAMAALAIATFGCADPYEVLSTRVSDAGVDLDAGDRSDDGLNVDSSVTDAGVDAGEQGNSDAETDAGLVPIETGLTHLVAGAEHTCLIADGRIFCFGTDLWAATATLDGPLTEPTRIETTGDWVDIDSHRNTTCAKNRRSELWCWGHNDFGQAGVPSPEVIVDFVQVPLPGPVSDFSVGDRTSCAIVEQRLYCWGAEEKGAFLTPDTGDTLAPRRIDVPEPPESVDSGRSNVCVRSQQRIWCWGANPQGMLVVDTRVDGNFQPLFQIAETQPSGVWTGLAMSLDHRCVVEVSGDVRCAGANELAQISDSGLDGEFSLVDTGLSGTEIAVAEGSTCTIDAGTLTCRGSNEFAQLGLTSSGAGDSRSVTVVGEGGYESVAVGLYHICASRAGRVVHCWGRGDAGQVGRLLPGANPQTTESVIPSP